MVTTQVSLPAIENAILDVCFAISEKNHQFSTWPNMNENDLWRELVACVLGSRVRFEAAHAAVERMDEMKLLTNRRRSRRFNKYEEDTVTALSGGYPFYRIRAQQIRRAAELFYSSNRSIRDFLDDSHHSRDSRRRFASELPGL